ncbi:MAG: hypothetical protein BRC29_03410 [Nanohaloarchaea archaeon SW_7_43_1]|nr:MAG: hypothetical protein BRC29_03410 [Nanohaloarchaea archaeon SW_7_43_1]
MKLKKKISALGTSMIFLVAQALGAANASIRTPDQEGFVGLMFQYPNEITGGILGYLFLVMIFVPSFVAGARSGDLMKGYLAAGFLTLGASMFLLAFEILGSTGFVAVALAYLIGLGLIDR